MSLSSKIWTAIVPLPERSIPWSGRWCWDTCHLGVSLLMERYSFAGGKSSSKEARNRRRSVPRGGLGFVSFPWQPSQCLIKLSPCPPPPMLLLLHLLVAPTVARHPSRSPSFRRNNRGRTRRKRTRTKRLVTSCSFLTTYGTSIRPCWSPSRTTTPRGSPRNI